MHGDHNFKNLAQTFLLAALLFPQKTDRLEQAAQNFQIADPNRGYWHQEGGKKIFLDAYNANPASVLASLKGFKEATRDAPPDQSLLVLGDMNELGEEAPLLHRRLGRQIRSLGYRHLAFVGRHAQAFQKGFGEPVRIYKNVAELKRDWLKLLKSYQIFFLKGSRSLKLETCLNKKT